MTDKPNQDSIQLTVKFFANLKDITGRKKVKIGLEINSTLFQLLEVLFDQFTELKNEILTEDNEPKEWIQILKNGRNIKYLDSLDTRLEDGDTISVFPPVAGG
jgi:molybdopterin synthase sulfur carrier subunit